MIPTGSKAHCYDTLRGRILCVTPISLRLVLALNVGKIFASPSLFPCV